MKKIFFACLFLVAFQGISQTQQPKPHSTCSFANQLVGIWIFDEMLYNLSGENLEEEGQSWEISKEEAASLKGKVKLTLFPDGTASTEVTVDKTPEYRYGYWKTSPDCKDLRVTIDDMEDIMEITAIDNTRMVLELEGEEMQMVYRKAN